MVPSLHCHIYFQKKVIKRILLFQKLFHPINAIIWTWVLAYTKLLPARLQQIQMHIKLEAMIFFRKVQVFYEGYKNLTKYINLFVTWVINVKSTGIFFWHSQKTCAVKMGKKIRKKLPIFISSKKRMKKKKSLKNWI